MEDPKLLSDGVQRGELRAVARAVRTVDDRRPGYAELLAELEPATGRAHRIGITGPPGSGKSTLVDAMTAVYRAQGRKVGVVAVDPSSPVSGGALLGDRIRMQRHALDPDVFIRSVAARGHLGGLSTSAGGILSVLDAAGFDPLLTETVGVGQSELEVAALADTTVVVAAPGLGDGVQADKAGLMEVADVFVVNKADQTGAKDALRYLEQMLSLSASSSNQRQDDHDQPGGSLWRPPVLSTVAVRGQGVEALADACGLHRQRIEQSATARRERARRQLAVFFRSELLAAAAEQLHGGRWEKALEDIERGDVTPHAAARALVRAILPNP